MAVIVYLLCAITSLICAVLLVRGYFASRTRLLLWSSLCFIGLTINNTLLFVDLVVIGPSTDLSMWRSVAAVAGIGILVYGLIWDAA